MLPDTSLTDRAVAPSEGAATPDQELDAEFYAALRAAGVSPEEAVSCLIGSGTAPSA